MHSRGLLLWTSDGRLARALTASNSGISRRYVCVVRGPALLSLAQAEFSDNTTMEESHLTNAAGKALQNRIANGVVTPYDTYHAQLVEASPIGTQEELDQVHSNKSPIEANDSENKPSKEKERFWWPHLACQQLSLTSSCELTGVGKTGCGGERSDNPIDIRRLEEENEDNEGPNFCCYSRVTIVVQEGKKREVRRLLRHCGYFVCDLYRTAFGPISLDNSTLEGTARVASSVELEWADQIIAQYESSKKRET